MTAVTKDNGMLKQIMTAIVKELVDEPEKCSVADTISDGGSTIILTIRTAQNETGKVIGRNGKTAQALRLILEAMAAKYRLRVMLEIADNKRRRSRNGNQ